VGFKSDLDDQLVSFNALTLFACKNRCRNNLYIEWDQLSNQPYANAIISQTESKYQSVVLS